eukprot:1184017-Amphidinium_carterae.1
MDIEGRWVRFFAQLPHSVSPTIGRRMSAAFFLPRLTHKVGQDLWFALLAAGFPVQEYFMSKLPQVISCVGLLDPSLLSSVDRNSLSTIADHSSLSKIVDPSSLSADHSSLSKIVDH